MFSTQIYNLRRGFKCLLFILTACLLFSCSSKPTAEGKYSFYILGKNGREYMLRAADLTKGEIAPEQGGVIAGTHMDRDIIVKDGFIYHHNSKTSVFSKAVFGSKSLVAGTELKLSDFSVENFLWISRDTLLLVGLNRNTYIQPKYAIVDTENMKLIAEGKMGIPKPSGKYTTLSIGVLKRKANELLLGYTYHITSGISDYITSDTMYLSKVSYPQMQLLTTDKDTRSTYPGGINTIQSYTFNDENGDLYFMSCPGIALGNRPEIATGIFRVKAESDVIDPDYFFNISASKIQNHAYGLWYLGNGKALIRAERKDLFKGLEDHYSTAHFEFYVLDLRSQTVQKLNLPLDKGTRRECVLVENGKAFIAVNSTQQGNFVWQYDIKTGTLTQGLQLSGDTDYILRMDRLEN